MTNQVVLQRASQTSDESLKLLLYGLVQTALCQGAEASAEKEAEMSSAEHRPKSKVGWYSLLVLQWILALWVPFYNTSEPQLVGIPFFYWYQLALVLACAVLTVIVYLATERSS